MSIINSDIINANNYEIQRQLEYFKYVAGKDSQGYPSGEGINIDVVLLPDLVLDIRRYKLKSPNSKEKCIAIGGRSGRIACILAHLAELEDGFFRPHLVAKTGNLGKLLLENEFYNPDRPNDSRKIVNYIFDSDREPRVTVWDDEKNNFESRTSFEESELNSGDILRDEFLKDVIKQSRIVYFSSIKTPNFYKLIETVIAEIKNTNARVFIDCTRSEESHLRELISYFLSTDIDTKNIEGIIISKEEKTHLESIVPEYKKNLEEKNIGLLYYSNSCVEYYDGEGAALFSSNFNSDDGDNIKIDFEHEDIPERFKAGFILALSVYYAYCVWDKEVAEKQNENIRSIKEEFDDFWKEKPIEKSILYGISLANADENSAGYCDLKSLFSGKMEMFPVYEQQNILFETVPMSLDSRHLKITNESLSLLIHLSGYRRNNLLKKSKNENREHGICIHKEECKYFKAGDNGAKSEEICTAVMMDLDGTLMNSTSERKRGLSNALKILEQDKEIESAIKKITIEKSCPIDFFESAVYNLWPLFKQLVKKDFRQEWNSDGWYITYILFLKNEKLLTNVKKEYGKIENPKDNPSKIIKLIKDEKCFNELKTKYEEIERECGELITKAKQEFRNTKLFAYKEAFDFLKSLQETGMYNLYVVSEGNSETQWLKLKSTGLSEFFPREKVLTTDDAANLNSQLKVLRQEQEVLNAKVREVLSDQISNIESCKEFSVFRMNIGVRVTKIAEEIAKGRDKEIIDGCLDEANVFERKNFLSKSIKLNSDLRLYSLRQLTIGFIVKLLQRLSTKGGISFYAAVIRAILDDPNTPLKPLRNFEALIDHELPTSAMKFAMIGDRQKNDIEPLILLLKRNRVLTLRSLAGGYYKTEPCNDERIGNNYPDYLIHTLAQAKALLLCDDIWSKKICTYETPFFCLDIEFGKEKREYIPSEEDLLNPHNISISVGLDIILAGIQMSSMSFPLTKKICRSILKEYFMVNKKFDAKPIMDSIGLNEPITENQDEFLHRTRLLSSLVLDTKLEHDSLKPYREKLIQRMNESKNYIIIKNIDTSELNNLEAGLKMIKGE
jgi:FMN phosphatase YigB (HAD superfamily)